MPGTFGAVETLMTSLRAQFYAQQIVSDNIANALTPGYSRRIPTLSAQSPLNLPALSSIFAPGQIGSGVTLAGIARVRDEFLDLQLRGEHSAHGRAAALQAAVDGMASLFPEVGATPGAGLVTAVRTFFADWNALAAAPGSAAARATLLADAQTMAGRIRDAGSTLTALQRSLDARLRDDLPQINALLARIADANVSVVRAQAAGGTDGAAADTRDQAIQDLSEYLKVDVARLGDGSVLVMAGNARTLVRGGDASTLVALTGPHEPAFADIGLREAGQTTAADITAELGGGTLQGLVTGRDGYVADERLEVDELASSLIAQVNLLHQAGYAQDGVTTNLPFFTVSAGFVGTEALNLAVNPALVGNPALLAASRLNGNGADGGQAAALGALQNLVMNASIQSTARINNLTGTIDPTLAMNSAVHTGLNGPNPFANNAADFVTAPAAGGTLVINGVSVVWTNADSLQTLVGKINAGLGGRVQASFDFSRQRLALVGDGPITAYDAAGNLTQVLRLETRITSLAAINAGIGPLDRPVQALGTLAAGALDYRTLASTGGAVTFQWQAPAGLPNTVTVNWSAGQTLAGLLGAFNAALGGAGAPFTFSFSAASQTITITGTSGLPASVAAPLSPLGWTDASGNLGFTLNLEAQPRFGDFGDALLAQYAAQRDGTQAALDHAEAGVTQVQQQVDAVAKVNLDQEKAQLTEYLRAYEAATRAMAAMDEMLNTLINRMAASTFSGTSTSVLNP